MSDLQGNPGEVRMTIHVTRKATGKTETHELVGRVVDEVKEKDEDNGSHAQHSGS